MVETAIAVGAVPAEWLYDDRFLITIIDILHTKTEAAKRKGR
jgi:hypothetical protein